MAGHELTHGFDDQGVQWNGVGALIDWMTNESAAGFNNMAQCVIDEYDAFCPLQGSGKMPECVNGEQTQGENIADNGGNTVASLSSLFNNGFVQRGLKFGGTLDAYLCMTSSYM